ncbi:hypothetical protein L226DRAFT_537871 [Lentinus tigrinus ALCF2SS1-7]|uniref:Uncharacterized protein n=1 Tax=Lentinus tigrinus ALCF2SS1-6 TaxID=1328759 RepID=A0A5C2S089_9APHY|nr:hypothetical protein L227DRAFT_578628 [Lentinus tigrinus ALCF2SS1-6]RPD71598.1 hypothetical protein L226DRAFT_537871 [Lentinus tigrinus ALCF2SS1-7]
MWSCNLSPDILSNQTLAALVCSAPPDDTSACIAICPNADLSGVGVRSAFYIQSSLNTLLVVFSRRDSVPSTWAATLLTGALVIAAMVQKYNHAITLHHAILTLNFATLSCISSLAVAPTLSIWRLTPGEYYGRRLARDILDDDDDDRDRMIRDAVETMTLKSRHRKRIERAQSGQRLILAIAILTQVVLQWAWGIWLFVSPGYNQTNCSGQTDLIFFIHPFTASYINGNMIVWVLWLLFSLGITMSMTIILALTSPSRARPRTVRSSPGSTIGSRLSSTPTSAVTRPVYEHLFHSAAEVFPALREQVKHFVFWYNIASVILWVVYITVSELQIRANCIFDGENSIASFGQITALLLSLAPLWSLTVAVYKWHQMQVKLKRRRKRDQHSSSSSSALGSQVALSTVGPDDDNDASSTHNKGPETTVTVVAAPACERAAPVSTMRPRTAHTRTHGRARSRSPAPPQSPSYARLLSLDHLYLPRTSTEEWNELATFRPAQ